jgi:hypothetical protein
VAARVLGATGQADTLGDELCRRPNEGVVRVTEERFRADPWSARQMAALADPVNGEQMTAIHRHRYINEAGDGALITTILAVDR